MSFQIQQEADTLDHLGLEGNQSVQRKHEHRDFHCALMPERRNIYIHIFELCNILETSNENIN